MSVSEAQKKATRKWDNKNKARKQYLNRRSVTKNFILKEAITEDLEQIEKYIEQKRKKIKNPE
ncbi:hypothetical protein [Lactobacillus crispatus]|uniref:hypothetical protein n=1 Tax=Lactobacillus crispatus TaxID=47770 RepID=UPI001F08B27D|nr:hypothetical protein [Lactobacillus crispatus]